MLIRVEGSDLPGRTCGPGPDFPDGHHNIHVAVQGRMGQQDLYGLMAADNESVAWELDCTIVSPPPATDLRGPTIHGLPGVSRPSTGPRRRTDRPFNSLMVVGP